MTLCFIFLCLLCANCTKMEGGHNPEFKKMKFSVDYNQHEIEVKSKWTGWDIMGLSLDGGKELNFFYYSEANSKEMELDGVALKIEYVTEYTNPNTGEIGYKRPYRISGDYFEIWKPSEKKLTVLLEKNLTGKERVIKIYVGGGDYGDRIVITQSGTVK